MKKKKNRRGCWPKPDYREVKSLHQHIKDSIIYGSSNLKLEWDERAYEKQLQNEQMKALEAEVYRMQQKAMYAKSPRCPKCASNNFVSQHPSESPHYSKWSCATCYTFFELNKQRLESEVRPGADLNVEMEIQALRNRVENFHLK